MSKLCCLCLLSACTYVCMIWQNRSCSTAHTAVYIHTYVYREAVNRAWGIKAEKKYTGELLHDKATETVSGEEGEGSRERLNDRLTDATRLHLAHARKLARATKRRRVRRLSAFFYRNVCAKHKKSFAHTQRERARARSRVSARGKALHTHTHTHAVAV